MSFGNQTVVLREFTPGTTRNRLNQPVPDEHDNTVTGCLMRPYRPTEVVTLTDIATEVWWCTAPPDPAALNATAAGVLIYDGTETPADVEENHYQITGVEPFPDFSGAVDHVKITCQRQVS